jgi:hypothetical protein
MIKYLFVAVSTSMLLGCVSSSKNEISCETENWHMAGKETALLGNLVTVFDKVQEQCPDTLASTAKVEFTQGYSEGITEYCTYESGYQKGDANIKTNNICPDELRTDFEKGYQLGNERYRERMIEIQKMNSGRENNMPIDKVNE